MLRTLFRVLLRVCAGFLACLLFYVLAAWLLPMIRVNEDFRQDEMGVPIFVRSNGVHTDLVLPLRGPAKDWSAFLPFANTASKDSAFTHVAFGWGDKGFYLETKEWADLKASTALKAAFGLSGSAMHVTFCQHPVLDEHCRSILVLPSTLKRLAAAVASGFDVGADGKPMWITDRHYDQNDAFYEGTGRYGLFFTCNTWANGVLKDAGLPAALWTATAGGILRHYQ